MTASPRIDLRPGISKPVLLMISRRQVEEADIASVLTSLKPFLATREDVWLCRGQMVLSVDGYNDDPYALMTTPHGRNPGMKNLRPETMAIVKRVETLSGCPMRNPVMAKPVDLKLVAQIPDQALAIDEVHIKTQP